MGVLYFLFKELLLLPTKFAKLGYLVKVKDDTWNEWYVDKVGGSLEEEYLPDYHKDSGGLWKATSGDEPKGHK